MGAPRSVLLRFGGALALVSLGSWALAASLDVSTAYKLRALNYRDVELTEKPSNLSYMSQNAQLGFGVKNIELTGGAGPEPATMDMALSLRAVGLTGPIGASTGPIIGHPFDRIAQFYPNANFIPFIESAYVRTHGLFGYPVDLTIGQQPYTVGSGLLLSDDGVGLPGVSARAALPWWDMKADGYVFQPRSAPFNAGNTPGSLMIYGVSLEVPSEGTWQFNEMMERELNGQLIELASPVAQNAPGGYPVSKAVRSFTSVHYQISYGPMFFDGEAAMEKGSATPIGPGTVCSDVSGTGLPLCAPNRITFNANAEVIRAKWKVPIRGQDGIARLTAARGSGANVTKPTTDTAFFPSHGHRLDGLERSGFGEFFQATPYDAFGGHSTSTASGLTPGVSGILSVGIGFTPPAYKGITFDFDYWLFQADRSTTADRNLGHETDIRARYGFRDRFNITASAALFSAGTATNPSRPSARRYMLEFAGRF